MDNLLFQVGLLLIVNSLLRSHIKARSGRAMYLVFLLGVPLHEFAHWVAAKVSACQITQSQFIPRFTHRQLGYVQYVCPWPQPLRALIHTWVGLAPVWLGGLILVGSPGGDLAQTSPGMTLLYGALGVIIAQCMLPSGQDLKIALPGLLILSAGAALLLRPAHMMSVLEHVIVALQTPLSCLLVYQLFAVLVIEGGRLAR
ncbi:hypothetical protein [Pseudoalteromonas rubra]|uniref:Peptidase M50 domain-containing protein n=1 Tax=Pseudoalteromonas rubra TaxID=43658 RepID=A0A0U3IE97_9GAMM|nr:hypothetical protein [Pseudoalteromonas rubra]ALU46112.1 hypothetical protein AT705_24430 [Pseudoalteromonas rubra]